MLFDQALQAMQQRKLGEAEVICRKILANSPKDFDALHMLAVICSEKGEYDESEKLFLQTISMDSNFPPGFYNYGSLLAKQKKYIAAIRQFDKALSLFPNFLPAHCDRGSVLKELGRFDEALAGFNKAVELAPKVPKVWCGRGNVHFQKRDYHSALNDYDRAIKIDPKDADAWVGRGNALVALMRFEEALSSFDTLLGLKPNFAEAWLARGNVCRELKRDNESLQAYDKAVALNPNLAEAWLARANAFTDLKQYEEASASYDKALSLKPNLAEAWLGRGHALTGLKRYNEASVSYDKTLALKPDLAEAWLARGDSFNFDRKYDEAFAAYDRALSTKPDLAEAWLGRGNVFKALERYDEAVAAYDKAQAIKPDLAEAQCNQALIRLVRGDLEVGWRKYEYRWNTKLMRNLKREFRQQVWLGDSDIKNKIILIHAEQGLGDTLMICRYVPMLASLGAKVILEVQPSLKPLLKNLGGISLLIDTDQAIPDFDVHCPIMSLPLAFRTTLATIPAKVPYLTVSNDEIDRWRSRLSGREMKVGIAWAGNPNHPQDLNRSIPLEDILPILEVGGARFFSLQKDLRRGDKEILDVNPRIRRLDQEIIDFEDTAAILMSLDLVISVDTSVVNLAGALGRPCFVLLPTSPDWRWLLDRSDSPWYPTAKLLRQTSKDDWSAVIHQVCIELEKLVADKNST